MIRPCIIAIVLACMLSSSAAAQCLQVVDDPAAPSVGAPEVDVRQVLRLLSRQHTALRGQYQYFYVAITRAAGQDRVDGRSVERTEPETFLRMLDGPNRQATFTFSREGHHQLRVYGVNTLPWPKPADIGGMKQVCPADPKEAQDLTVFPKILREDFSGVRAQWWGAYRPVRSVELGSSVFFGRIGIATSAELFVRRAILAKEDPARINPVVGSIEFRYRGARGYVGGGVRYYPDEEADHEQWRPVVTFADELPSFKGRPVWLLLDLRVEQYKANFIKGLRPSFGVRFDLWGSQP